MLTIRIAWTSERSSRREGGDADALGEKLIDAHLDEFKALRTEIIERVKNQLAIVAANVTLTGLAVAILQLSDRVRVVGILAVPFFSFALSALYAAQDSSIAVAASYINRRIRPKVARLSGARYDDLWAWESYRSARMYSIPFRNKALEVTTHLAGVAPGMIVISGSLLAVFTSSDFRGDVPTYGWALLTASVLLHLMLVPIWMRIWRLYGEISGTAGAEGGEGESTQDLGSPPAQGLGRSKAHAGPRSTRGASPNERSRTRVGLRPPPLSPRFRPIPRSGRPRAPGRFR